MKDKRLLDMSIKRILLSILAIGWFSASYADEVPAVVIQVPETFTQHPIRLNHPRVDYWHNRGKSAEKAGFKAFQAAHYKTSSCQTDASGQALLVIVPNMFFNAQRGIFHGEITVKVYTPSTPENALGKPILTMKGEGESRGWLSYNAESFIQKSYQQAYEHVIQQLQENSSFKQAINKTAMQNYHALCESINALTQEKLYH